MIHYRSVHPRLSVPLELLQIITMFQLPHPQYLEVRLPLWLHFCTHQMSTPSKNSSLLFSILVFRFHIPGRSRLR